MTLLRANYILFLTSMLVFSCWLKPVNAADFEALDEIGLMGLDENLQAMRKLAPQLRAELRSVRMTLKFDVREIHNIEDSIGKAQTDIERLLAMHKTDRVNSIRARFMVDDLRRKAATLNQGLSHVTQRIQEKYGVTKRAELQGGNHDEVESRLLSHLQDYTRLVSQSLLLVSGRSQ